MDHYSFVVQQRTFDVHGYALNPSNTSGQSAPIVGSLNSAHQNGYNSIDNMRTSRAAKKDAKRKRAAKGDLGVVDGDDAYQGPWAGWEGDKEVDPVIEEEAEEWREEKRRREEASTAAKEKVKQAREEKSIFHGEPPSLQQCQRKKIDALCRERAHRLRWTDIHAYPDRCGCQAQPIGRDSSPKRLRARAMYTYLGKFSVNS